MVRYRKKLHRIKKKKNIFKGRVFWRFILAVLFFGSFSSFMLFFEPFQIKNIRISGNDKISTDQIKELILRDIKKQVLFLRSESIFLTSSNKINNDILTRFPEIKEAIVKKQLFDTINIDIVEREPVFILCDSGPCFFIDNKGVAFEKTDAVSYFIVRQEESKEIILGKQALEVDIINHILKITKDLKEKFQIIVKSADILSGSRLNINTNEEWKIYFNLSGDMNLQITKLNLLLEKEITQESREGLEYIDLRFAERVYYK